MKVHELMSHPVHTCRAEDSLETAARLLWENDCGIVPVVDHDGRAQAAITDRDICMGAYTRGQRLADLRVGDSMSRSLVSCRFDEDVAVAASRMAEHAVRRLPVLDGDGRIRGVLSLSDLARRQGDTGAAAEALKVLAAVSRSRSATPERARQLPLPQANPKRAATLMASKAEGEC
jgi:CBS domain-containing protein